MEINPLIFHALVEGKSLFLPGIGSFVLEHRDARRLSARRLAPPSRRIVFQLDQQGTSLPALIGATGQETYDRWLESVRTPEGLSIPGVGDWKGTSDWKQARFIPTPELDAALNPLGHKPLQLRPRRSKYPFVLLVVLLLLIAGGFSVWMFKDSGWFSFFEPGTPPTVEQPAAPTQQPAPVEIPAPAPQPVLDEQATPAPADDTLTVSHTTPGRTYVVLGVYSTEENARRAVAELHAQQPNGKTTPVHLYYYGDKWMISVFESDNAAEARTFIRNASDLPEGLWPYMKR